MEYVDQIAPDAVLENRPFTHPDHTAADRRIMAHMIVQLGAYTRSDHAPRRTLEARLHPESDGSLHRIFVPDLHEFLNAPRLVLVGFYGQKREEADSRHFSPLDRILRDRIPEFKDIMSYSTLAISQDDFANLVLLRNDAVKAAWHDDPTHLDAIERSPGYYESIRIYNGELMEGIGNPDALRLTQVKYWDYRTRPTWRGVRSLS